MCHQNHKEITIKNHTTMTIDEITKKEMTAQDVLYAMVNYGADPVYVECEEDAEEIAAQINDTPCYEIEKGTEDWDMAKRQLDLEDCEPEHIFIFHHFNQEAFKVCFFEDYWN